MKLHRLLLALLFGISSAWGADRPPASKVKTAGIVLYQPEAVIQQRLSSMKELTDYIQQFQAVLGESLQESNHPEALDVVVIVKPGRKARVWFVSSLPKAPERSALAGKLQTLSAPLVQGPVAFALSLNLAGAERKNAAKGFSPPMPEEWSRIVKGSTQPVSLPDGIVERSWRD